MKFMSTICFSHIDFTGIYTDHTYIVDPTARENTFDELCPPKAQSFQRLLPATVVPMYHDLIMTVDNIQTAQIWKKLHLLSTWRRERSDSLRTLYFGVDLC